MTVSAADLTSLADTLQLYSPSNESIWRCAASRAYYGALHHCNEWHGALAMQGETPPENVRGTHEQTVYRLTKPLDTSKASLSKQKGYQLRHLKTYRTNADYKLSESFTQNDMHTTIELAKKLIATT
jgi:hypothetical protein